MRNACMIKISYIIRTGQTTRRDCGTRRRTDATRRCARKIRTGADGRSARARRPSLTRGIYRSLRDDKIRFMAVWRFFRRSKSGSYRFLRKKIPNRVHNIPIVLINKSYDFADGRFCAKIYLKMHFEQILNHANVKNLRPGSCALIVMKILLQQIAKNALKDNY